MPRQPSPQSSGAPHGSIQMNNTVEQTLTNHLRFGRSFYSWLTKRSNIQSLRAMYLRTRHPDLEVVAHRPRSALCTSEGVNRQEQRCWIINTQSLFTSSVKQLYTWNICGVKHGLRCVQAKRDGKAKFPRFGINHHFLHRVVLNLTWAPGVIHKW